MPDKVLLITGWGVGTEVLTALQNQLYGAQVNVDLINIFDPEDPVELQRHLDLAEHYDVLMGWSLGGQLASVLADQLYKQTGQAKPLITLASNPCFVQQATWPNAMPQAEFATFQQSYLDQPEACIKRFCYLISQGGRQPKQDWLMLQSLQQPQDIALMQQGLISLGDLNTLSILQNYPGQQFHLLATQDHLVPLQIAQDLQYFPAKFLKIIKIDGSHAFPVVEVEQTCEQIVQICQQL